MEKSILTTEKVLEKEAEHNSGIRTEGTVSCLE